jgi:hypothetical protein
MANVNLVPVLSLAVTLIVAQAVKLQITNQLSADNFTRAWAVGSGGLLAGVVVNQLFTSRLLKSIEESGKYTKEGLVLVSDVLNTLVLLTTQNVFIKIMNGENITFSPAWFRGIFTWMTGVILFDILVEPQIPDGRHKDLLIGIVKRASAVATSDYMTDLDFDDLRVNVISDTAGIIVGDLSTTPIANMVE